MKKVLASLCMAAGIAGFSGVAFAEGNGLYAAIDIGQLKAKDYCNTDGVAGITVTSCDDTDTAYRLGLGYQFNENFGLEANYVDFGNAGGSGTYLGVPFTVNTDADAFQLAVTGALPLNESFALTGKIGAARINADTSVSALGIPLGSVSDNSTELTYGIGVRYNINKTMAIRAQYEDFGKIDDVDLTLLSVGMTFGF